MARRKIAVPTVGSVPFQPLSGVSASEQAIYQDHMMNVIKNHNLGGRNPVFNDDLELAISRELGFTANAPVGPSLAINERFSKRHPVADLNTPRDPVAIMQTALRYSLENTFVAKGLRVKTDFTCKDFRHKSNNATAKDFFDAEAIRLELYMRIREIVWCMVSLGVAVVYWGGEDNGIIRNIEILDPRVTKVLRLFGKYKVYLKIDQRMRDAVRDPMGRSNIENKAVFESLPKKWIKQIELAAADMASAQNSWIELDDDTYTVISNRYTPFNFMANTFSGGPLQAAFEPLQRYRLLAAGDFAVAWNVKNMITLISEGSAKDDIKTYAPSDDLRLANLQAKFSGPDYSFTVFCDPTTEVRYVIPPIEVFDPKKYAQVEKEIKENINLPSFMWNNDGGGTFGAAMAEVKMLIEEVYWLRIALREQFFRPLYTILRSRAKKPGFAANAIVLPTFDENSLMDDTVRLQAMEQGYGGGAVSLGTYQENLGLDPEYEMTRLTEEHDKYGSNLNERQNPTVAQPLYENSQGNQNPDSGRPKTDLTPQAPKPRAPRTKK